MSPGPLVLPMRRILNSPESRTLRAASIEEAKRWPGDLQQSEETWVYLLKDEYSIGVSKPGKEANPARKYVNPYYMLPLIRRGDERIPFDAGFNDIFRALYDIGAQSVHTRQEEAAKTLGAVLFRAAWCLDHLQANGQVRLKIPLPAFTAIQAMPSKRVQTPSREYDLPALVLLYFLEMLALNEDVKYAYRRGAVGRTGRPSTYQTCTRALACGLGLEHPMIFAYGLSRGNGVATLPRVRAEAYFSALSR